MTTPATFDKWFDAMVKRIATTPYSNEITKAKAEIVESMRLPLKDAWARNISPGGTREVITGGVLADMYILMKNRARDVERALTDGGIGGGHAAMYATLIEQSLAGCIAPEISRFIQHLLKDWEMEQSLMNDEDFVREYTQE